MSPVLAAVAVLAIIYVVPLLIYGAASTLGWLKLPTQSSPQAFLFGVLITKVGTTAAFVFILLLSGEVWGGRWLLYGLIWFAMFSASELGDAIAGRSSWAEAMLGVISEAIYAPAAALAAHQILGLG